MNTSEFDVIIVGGGPAGSITAWSLARAGARVAVIDASVFPRSKPCGGGLQARALLDIPFDVSHLFRGTMSGMSLSFGLRDVASRAYAQPLVHSILRSEFDHFLIERAVEAGAHLYEGVSVRGLDADDGGPVRVRISNGELKAQCLVGADGANSVVRGLLNSRHDYFWQAAVYCEVPYESLNAGAIHRDCMLVDWGTLPSGYAWAFPKDGSVNVGAGGPAPIARHLKKYVAGFLAGRGLLRDSSIPPLRFIGHQLPTLTARARLSSRRVILVGDAAGLVEPFTGDGISFACHSARLASESILRTLNSRAIDLTGYHTRMLSTVGPELMWARKLLAVSVSFPKLIPHLFNHSDQVWQTFCKTLRGEASFQRLKKDVLGPFEFAWKGIDWFSRLRERRILKAGSPLTV
jgi:geranylgeranyl reductase family protein